MQKPRRLMEILGSGSGKMIRTWEEAKPETPFATVPSGVYRCLVSDGGLDQSPTTQTPFYRLVFTVQEGPHAGRKLRMTLWITEDAAKYTKGHLVKLGINHLQQMEFPLPPGIICDVNVVVRTSDTGSQFNLVKGFEVIRIEPPVVDPFAPDEAEAKLDPALTASPAQVASRIPEKATPDVDRDTVKPAADAIECDVEGSESSSDATVAAAGQNARKKPVSPKRPRE